MRNILFVGLGNPGRQYENTRHNLGMRALNAWREHSIESNKWDVTDWEENIRGKYTVSNVVHGDVQITCLFPLTFMNSSGEAVSAHVQKNNMGTDNILIIHDELEIPLGDVRRKAGGSARGHNGVRSIHELVGTRDIPRLMLGIGRPIAGQDVETYVLSTFLPDEKEKLQESIEKACRLLTGIAWDKLSH